jgi:5-amino-6-(5-phosphoribosylamino)uracil reductase
MAVRDQADAIVFGAGTFRAFSKPRRSLNQRKKRLHCLLSRRWELPIDAHLFDTDFEEDVEYPVWIASENPPPPSFSKRISSETVRHIPLPKVSGPKQVTHLLKVFKDHGIQTLLFEGGGELMADFLEARAIDELYLTFCPKLIGGHQTASLVGGSGLNLPVQTSLISLKQVEEELYLHLQLRYGND